MDINRINSYLHSIGANRYYRIKTGERLSIDLPKVPMTRHTQYLQLAAKKEGDVDCFIEESANSQKDGIVYQDAISGRAVCPGVVHILLRAIDSLSGEEIAGVEPVMITVEVGPESA